MQKNQSLTLARYVVSSPKPLTIRLTSVSSVCTNSSRFHFSALAVMCVLEDRVPSLLSAPLLLSLVGRETTANIIVVSLEIGRRCMPVVLERHVLSHSAVWHVIVARVNRCVEITHWPNPEIGWVTFGDNSYQGMLGRLDRHERLVSWSQANCVVFKFLFKRPVRGLPSLCLRHGCPLGGLWCPWRCPTAL